MKNIIRDTIITAIEVSKISKVPMLFIANPGVGKTTAVNLYAQKNGYHVESLIGSAFDRSEVLGYMVNKGGDALEVLNPTWFNNIKEKAAEGVPSILFIDELSTAPGDVQGSLYRLIFERTIGNNRKLPDDCIILSAANYKENLPSYFDITSPSLNRFCLINLCPKNYNELLDEFLQDEDDLLKAWPKFTYQDLDSNTTDNIRNAVKTFFKDLFEVYADADSSKGILNLANKQLASTYESDIDGSGEVCNFMSPRTIGYLNKCVQAMVALKIDVENPAVNKIVDGLIGNGTNSFTEQQQIFHYRRTTHQNIKNLLTRLQAGINQKVNISNLFEEEESISGKAQKLSLFIDSINFNKDAFIVHYQMLYEQITKEYPDSVHGNLTKLLGRGVPEAKRTKNEFKLISDVSTIQTLLQTVIKMNLKDETIEKLNTLYTKFVEVFSFYTTFSM